MAIERVNVERQTTPERINQIINHEAIRPFVDGGKGPIDMKKIVDDQRNIILVGEHGSVVLRYIMDGLYEMHTQILPEGRGAWTRQFGASCAHYVFTQTPAIEVLTRVPEPHMAARRATRDLGMTLEFVRPDEGFYLGEKVNIEIYSIRLQDWMKDAPWLEELGQSFHEQLHAEAKRLGIQEPAHEPDANHNRYVGACMEMAVSGLIGKAVAFYNRWAYVSRHALVEIVSVDPPMIRMDIGIMSWEDGQVRIETCH